MAHALGRTLRGDGQTAEAGMGPADWGFVVSVWSGPPVPKWGASTFRNVPTRLGTGFLVSRTQAVVVVQPEGGDGRRLWLLSRSVGGTGRVVHSDRSSGLTLSVVELDAPVPENVPIPALGAPPAQGTR